MKRKKRNILGINLDDRNTQASLRIFGYGIMLLAASVIAAVLVATARGYDINRETGEVIQNGLILVDSVPVDAEIFVDNVDEQDRTPGRLPLPAGSHLIELRRDGYRTWSKQFDLVGSDVQWVYYPRLFPETIERTIINDFAGLEEAVQSADRRWLAVIEDKTKPAITLVDLENVLNAPVAMTIPATALPALEEGEKASYDIVEWSGNNRHILLTQTVKKAVTYIVLDRTKQAEAVNISEEFGLTLSNVHFRGNRSDRLYALVESSARELQLDGATVSGPLLRDLEHFIVNGDDRLLFVQKSPDGGKPAVGIWRNGVTTIVDTINAASSDYFLSFDKYDDDNYFTVGADSVNTLKIYRNPEDAELGSLKPFKQLTTAAPLQAASFSFNKQFVAVQSGNEFRVYDFEEKQAYNFTLDKKIPKPNRFSWIDGHRIVVQDSDGLIITTEFDGTNTYELGLARRNYLPIFDRQSERMFTITVAPSSKVVLNESRLVVEQ